MINNYDGNDKNELDIFKVVYGLKENWEDKHYIYKGFENHSEYYNLLNTLLNWELTPKESIAKFLDEPNSELQKIEDYLLVKWLA